MKINDIIDAYCRIRTIDQTIPDNVLDFMKDAAIEKLTQINKELSLSNKCKHKWKYMSGSPMNELHECQKCGILA